MMGREHLVDSNVSPLTDPSMVWHVHFLDSLLGRQRTGPLVLTQMVFAPVIFEGVTAKVTILFGPDSSFGARVVSPYPFRRQSPATLDDFKNMSRNIQKSLGEPNVYSGAYIDYMDQGREFVLGNLRDGTITVNIWRLHP